VSKSVKISIIVFIIVLLGIGLLVGYKYLSILLIDNTDYIKQGDTQFSRQEYSQASDSYQKALAKNEQNKDLYLKIAKVYESKGRFKDAIDNLKKGLDQLKGNTDLQFQIGEDASILAKTDIYYVQIAIDAYIGASKDSGLKNVSTYKAARLISSLSGDGDLNKAKELYLSIPDFQPAKYELVLYEIDNPDSALEKLDAAKNTPQTEGQESLLDVVNFDKDLRDQLNALKQDIASKKKLATILNSKGYTAYKSDRCEFGVDFFKQAVTESEKDVFYPSARLALGECLQRLKRFDESKSYVLPVYEKNKDSIEARLVLRHVYKGLGDIPNMKKIYDELIALKGQDYTIRIDYAVSLESVSDYVAAATQYEWLGLNLPDNAVVSNIPNTNLALNNAYLLKAYGIYSYRLNNFGAAQKIIENSIQKNTKFIESKTANELITWAEYMQSPLDKNLENDAFNKAKDLQNTDAYYHTAMLAKIRGDKKLAQEKAVAAHNLDKDGFIEKLALDIVNELQK
jgi:hypothetical protein